MVPILMPILQSLQIDLVYFGLTTPPVGVCLYGVSGIANVPIERVFKTYLPFLAVLLLVLFLLMVFPGITLFLPRVLLGS
ncbi:MAG: hypothetical protein Kow009_05090 [Spirochaetales bacterium]